MESVYALAGAAVAIVAVVAVAFFITKKEVVKLWFCLKFHLFIREGVDS